MNFQLTSQFQPTGDQPQAISTLTKGVRDGLKNQVLLGVTGSGKTFTIANVIQDLQMPTLVISHNKTLAGQLYQEFRDFFPQNAVSYFVSYYDYYQPEAYMPATDTYIEKEADINELIDKLRLQTTANILSRTDVIVIASVSCIYNIGSPAEYRKFRHQVKIGDAIDWKKLTLRLTELLYERSEFDFKRGTFRVRGNHIDIYVPYEDYAIRIEEKMGNVSRILKIDPLTGSIIAQTPPSIPPQGGNIVASSRSPFEGGDTSEFFSSPFEGRCPEGGGVLQEIIIYPAELYLTDPAVFKPAEKHIRADLAKEYSALRKQGKQLEAERLLRKVNYDLEMLSEVGYVNGIENYSRYFDGRKPGDAPHSLLDFFKVSYGNDFLVCIDESHMSVPQIRGMYNGDRARKKTLIDFGFRLNAAYDNRPLTFEEFYKIPPHIMYISATPNEWEKEQSDGHIVEQLIRPTGIIDPKIEVRPSTSEIPDLIDEVAKRTKRGEKTLVTTLTKKTAEDLTEYLTNKDIRAAYLHSDIHTLERSDVLDNLRKNEFDVLIGVNLLREGLDLPEVTLVAILDADKEGFLRSRTALIQTMGRAARNIGGSVILYADTITKSITAAMEEIQRRRAYQMAYNKKHHIDPKTIHKPIREKIAEKPEESGMVHDRLQRDFQLKGMDKIDASAMTPFDKKRLIKKMEREMKKYADDMNFEAAIMIRDKVRELRG